MSRTMSFKEIGLTSKEVDEAMYTMRSLWSRDDEPHPYAVAIVALIHRTNLLTAEVAKLRSKLDTRVD